MNLAVTWVHLIVRVNLKCPIPKTSSDEDENLVSSIMDWVIELRSIKDLFSDNGRDYGIYQESEQTLLGLSNEG